jgi:hypothetical protein
VDKGNFLFLNAATGEVRYRIPPTKRRLRLHRPKLSKVLSEGIDVQYGKEVAGFEKTADGVVVQFQNGTSVNGTILIGADGNNSKGMEKGNRIANGGSRRSSARKALNQAPHERLPIQLIAIVQHFTPEQAAALRALDTFLFHGLDPVSQNYFWYSIQEMYQEEDGHQSFDALCIISWRPEGLKPDDVPDNDRDRIAVMKERAKGFAEPLRSIFADIPDDLPAPLGCN